MAKWKQQVVGTPDPALSQAEVDRIISQAAEAGQNVYFGEGWRRPQTYQMHMVYIAQTPPLLGFWDGLVGSIAKWF